MNGVAFIASVARRLLFDVRHERRLGRYWRRSRRARHRSAAAQKAAQHPHQRQKKTRAGKRERCAWRE